MYALANNNHNPRHVKQKKQKVMEQGTLDLLSSTDVLASSFYSYPFLTGLCSSLNFDSKNAGAVIQEAIGTSDQSNCLSDRHHLSNDRRRIW